MDKIDANKYYYRLNKIVVRNRRRPSKWVDSQVCLFCNKQKKIVKMVGTNRTIAIFFISTPIDISKTIFEFTACV